MRKCKKYARNAQQSCSTGPEYAMNASVRSRWRSNESAAQGRQQEHASESNALNLGLTTRVVQTRRLVVDSRPDGEFSALRTGGVMRREAGTRRRAASVCGNGAAKARIRGWPRTTRGQHAIVGRWLRRGRCSLVGTDRHQLEVAGHLVRPHGAGVQGAGQSPRRFRRSDFNSIFHSIFDSRV